MRRYRNRIRDCGFFLNDRKYQNKIKEGGKSHEKWNGFISCIISLLLSGSISVCAAERTYTDRSEVIGTAVVVGDEDSAGGSSLFSRPGTIATITPGKNHSYGSWGTCEFNVKTETGNHLASVRNRTQEHHLEILVFRFWMIRLKRMPILRRQSYAMSYQNLRSIGKKYL